MRRKTIAMIAAAAVLGLVAVVLAQDATPTSLETSRRNDAMKRIEMYRIFKLTEMLELDADGAAKLFPIIQRYDEQFRTLTERKDQLSIELQRELKKPEPDKKKLLQTVDAILAAERDAMKVREAQFKELRKVLNGEQYAKFLIFDQRFREDLNRMIIEIKRKRTRHGTGTRRAPSR